MIFNTETADIFKNVFYSSSIGLALVAPDGRFFKVNPMLCEMTGYTEEELMNKTFAEITHPHDLESNLQNYKSVLENKLNHYQAEKRYLTKQGDVLHVLLNVSAKRAPDGTIEFFISQMQDISDRKKIENRLKENEEHLSQIIETIPAGVTIVDMKGEIIFANKKAEQVLNMNKEDITDKEFDSPSWKITTLEGNHIPAEALPFAVIKQTGRSVEKYVHAIHTGKGKRKILSVNGTPLFETDGTMSKIIFSLKDITHEKETEYELKKANRLLKKQSESDGLTGIPNRRHFDEQLEKIWGRFMGLNAPVSLIMFDLDCFKAFNDEYGHQAGDDCLKDISSEVDKLLSSYNAIFARYGGEEFAVILPFIQREEALQTAEALRRTVEGMSIPHKASSISGNVTVSAGVATLIPALNAEPGDLIRRADSALYMSKGSGRNRVTGYSSPEQKTPDREKV